MRSRSWGCLPSSDGLGCQSSNVSIITEDSEINSPLLISRGTLPVGDNAKKSAGLFSASIVICSTCNDFVVRANLTFQQNGHSALS